MHVFINGDEIGVKVFRDGVDVIAIKDYVRRACGMDAWAPKRRKPTPRPAVPHAVRNHFFGETLAVCRLRRRIAPDHFALLINDLRLRGDAGREALKYAREFGFGPADLERCMGATPRHYTADERAKILNLTFAERQHLGLRRTGSIDVDKAGRERARRDRYNAKRRAARAGARGAGVNKTCQVEGRPGSNRQQGDFEERKVVKIAEARPSAPVELPVPAISHEQLAEMWLLDRLGDGDSDRGVPIAVAMGAVRFEALRRQLVAGELLLSAVRLAARGVGGAAA
ncbi:hypothetical protein [Rhodopseudomonas palustris]|nr:hypothetical protein [Rhodopseudomonas palustris]